MKTNTFSTRCNVILGLLTKIISKCRIRQKKFKKRIKYTNEFQAEYSAWIQRWLTEHYGNRALYIKPNICAPVFDQSFNSLNENRVLFFTSQKPVYLIWANLLNIVCSVKGEGETRSYFLSILKLWFGNELSICTRQILQVWTAGALLLMQSLGS